MESLGLEQVRQENLFLLHLASWVSTSVFLIAVNLLSESFAKVSWSLYASGAWAVLLFVHWYVGVYMGRRRYEEDHRRLEKQHRSSAASQQSDEPSDIEELRSNLLRSAETARDALRQISPGAVADVSRGESRALEIVAWLEEADAIAAHTRQAHDLRQSVAATLSKPGGEALRAALQKLLAQLDIQDVRLATLERETRRRRSLLDSFLLVAESAGVAQSSSEVLAAVSEPLRERVDLLEADSALEDATDLAGINQAVEAERIREEVKLAQELQRSILPDAAPPITGLSVAHLCCPSSEVGGDYFDFYRLSDERLLIAIGDASGHGLDSSMVSSMAKSALYTQVSAGRSLEEAMAEMNRLMYDTLGKRRLMTLALLEIDTELRRLSWVNAGQVFPLIRREDRILELKQSSYPLGVRRGTRYERQEMDLELGDLVLLLTDGLFEAAPEQGETYGWDRVVDRLRGTEIIETEAIVEDFAEDLRQHLGETPLPDDVTLIAIRVED
jgi:serine phosphatase RsbU (regulator of sigma subunit)